MWPIYIFGDFIALNIKWTDIGLPGTPGPTAKETFGWDSKTMTATATHSDGHLFRRTLAPIFTLILTLTDNGHGVFLRLGDSYMNHSFVDKMNCHQKFKPPKWMSFRRNEWTSKWKDVYMNVDLLYLSGVDYTIWNKLMFNNERSFAKLDFFWFHPTVSVQYGKLTKASITLSGAELF